MRDTDLCIQAERSLVKLIEGDDHRLTKAVSRILVQRCNGHLMLPWTYTRHPLYAFEASLEAISMADFIQATKAVLFNCRRIPYQRSTAIEPQTRGGSHRERTSHIQYDGDMWRQSDEWALGGVDWESGGAPSCH